MRYAKFHISLDEKPPYFVGSQLRGALGYALKRTSCPYITAQNISESSLDSESQASTLLHTPCATCQSQSQCVYYVFYEQKGYHAYRFDFSLNMPQYDFSLFVFEGALSFLPEIGKALIFMLTTQGLGGQCFQHFSLTLNDMPIKNLKSLPSPLLFTPPTQTYEFLKLTFITPLRIKKHNRLLKSFDLELKDMLHSIYQRSLALTQSDEPKGYPHEIKGDILYKNLTFVELTRKSNRQNTSMNLGGLMGELILRGLDMKSYELLRLGEIIGVGKQCVFGLGKFTLEALNE